MLAPFKQKIHLSWKKDIKWSNALKQKQISKEWQLLLSKSWKNDNYKWSNRKKSIKQNEKKEDILKDKNR